MARTQGARQAHEDVTERVEERLERLAEGGRWRFMSCCAAIGQIGITMGLGGEYIGTVVATSRVDAEVAAHELLTRWLEARARRSRLRLV